MQYHVSLGPNRIPLHIYTNTQYAASNKPTPNQINQLKLYTKNKGSCFGACCLSLTKSMASIRRTPCLLFCLLVSLALSASHTARSQTFYGARCTNVTMNGTYMANLNTLLSTISSDIRGNTGFYNVSYGQGTDEVNAIALCRGELGEDDCRTCITNATDEVKKRCPNQIAGTVWLEKCMLRYSNESIFRKLEKVASAVTTSAKDVSNPSQFNQVVLTLLNGLKDQAAAGSSLLNFATGSAKVSDSESVYALLQCTPDLSEADCKDCLSTATSLFQQNCEGKQDCRVSTASCNLRYENYRFYNSLTDVQPPTLSPASPPASLPSPVASPPPAANTATGKGNIQLFLLQFLFSYTI